MNLRIGPWTKKSTANGEVPVYIIINVNGEEKSMLEKMQDSVNFQPKPEKGDKSFFDKVREMFT